jgi:hypothetical protein
MARSKKPDQALLLAERMLEILSSKREFGGDAYPPTLRHLGELCDGAPSPELIVKAAKGKAFTAKAVVIEKVERKPTLDSPVYVKGDEPKKPKSKSKPGGKDNHVDELARRMLAVLESQRVLGSSAYPPTLHRLAELCEVNPYSPQVLTAASHVIMAGQTVVVAKNKKKPLLDAPVALKEDIDGGFSTIMPALLRFALSTDSKTTKGTTTETTAFGLAELKKRFIPELQGTFDLTLQEGFTNQKLPPDVAWVLVKGKPLLFLVANLRPEPPTRPAPTNGHTVSPPQVVGATPAGAPRPAPSRDFPRSFLDAFERLDRRNGSTNFVKLADLRHALSDFSHEEFDAGLRQLRIDGLFSLDSHEGLHGSLTHEERESGVREAGSLLVYASRR